MRQIRYRAWIGSENTDLIDMPMHYEYDVECIYEGKYATVENGWDIHGVYENVPLELDTGLKDKNGESIWEGDTLMMKEEVVENGYVFDTYVVEFSNGKFYGVPVDMRDSLDCEDFKFCEIWRRKK